MNKKHTFSIIKISYVLQATNQFKVSWQKENGAIITCIFHLFIFSV